jgi:hypothetical protein
MVLNDEQIKNRFAAACQQFEIENATSVCNLNCAISMHRDGVEKYKNIPDSVIESVKRLIAHNNKLIAILFNGEKEIDCKVYLEKQEREHQHFLAVLKEIAELNKK